MRNSVKTSMSAAAIIAAGMTMASAADMAVKSPATVQSTTAFSWRGFYVGANVGYGWGRFDGSSTLAGNVFVGTVTGPGSVTVDGISGGGQLGYNWQMGAIVLGVEADIQGASERDSSTTGCGVGCSFNSTTKIDSFATVRGRLGVTAFDRGLVYVTGGWAWMHANNTQTFTTAGATTSLVDASASKGGWTVGAGYEQMLWDRWSGKIEYLYMQADGATASSTIPVGFGGGAYTTSGRVKNNVLRVGLNYHF